MLFDVFTNNHLRVFKSNVTYTTNYLAFYYDNNISSRYVYLFVIIVLTITAIMFSAFYKHSYHTAIVLLTNYEYMTRLKLLLFTQARARFSYHREITTRSTVRKGTLAT